MDQERVPGLENSGVTTKKRRSQTSRRPRPEAQPDRSPMSSTPISDDMGKVSSDENIGDGNSGGKMLNLNQCVSRSLPVSGADSGSNAISSNGMCDGAGSQSKLKKVKLKVGGVTRTLQTKSNSNGSLVKANQSPDNGQLRQRLTPQGSSDESHSPPLGKKTGRLQGIPWKDFSKGGFSVVKEDMGRTSAAKNSIEKQGDKSDSVRKSKRVPKRRVLDAGFDEDDEDDEIRYLEKLKTSKIMGYKDLESQPTRRLMKGGKSDHVEDVGKKSRLGDTGFEEEEEVSDGEHEGKKKRNTQRKDLSELPAENKREMALTSRQRALLSKDAPSASGGGQIEFPNGLPPAAPRKQKEKLTEVEQQLKKVEAAQRRRIQNEKAARESEAEAIRKILGQDSSRKKREEKIKKRQEEMAQGKATNAQMLSTNTIRTVMGPTGTTVTFPQDLGLPIFFASKCNYPPPREKCAGPSCSNAYKYRDSKSNLPLCSLQCYKAVNEKTHTENAC